MTDTVGGDTTFNPTGPLVIYEALGISSTASIRTSKAQSFALTVASLQSRNPSGTVPILPTVLLLRMLE